jgi:hypothetical protein
LLILLKIIENSGKIQSLSQYYANTCLIRFYGADLNAPLEREIMPSLKFLRQFKYLMPIFSLLLCACSAQPLATQVEISIQTLNRDAGLAIERGDYLKALVDANTAYEKAGKYFYYEQRLYALMHLGQIAYHTGSLKKADIYFREVEKLLSLKEADEPEIRFLNLLYLSEVSFTLNKKDRQRKLPTELFSFLKSANKILEKLKDKKKRNTAKLESLQIQVLIYQKEYKDAKLKIQKLKEIYEDLDDVTGLAQAEGYLAEIFMQNNKALLALPHLKKALKLSQEKDQAPDIAFFLARISKLKQELAQRENSPKKRKEFLKKAIWGRLQCVEINKGLGNTKRLIKDYLFLTELYAKLAREDANKSDQNSSLTYKKLVKELQEDLNKK